MRTCLIFIARTKDSELGSGSDGSPRADARSVPLRGKAQAGGGAEDAFLDRCRSRVRHGEKRGMSWLTCNGLLLRVSGTPFHIHHEPSIPSSGGLRPLCKDWHIDPTLPAPWSTDWRAWHGRFLFEHTVAGKRTKLFKDVFCIAGAIEPLAYRPNNLVLLAADGSYYVYNDCVLYRALAEFAS
ncbi:hypothetical protein DFH09DRAFT_1067595 [Mycena vulgaris]|nr:hypothetical protein DFH09DRAFT_1067595 [Mycena vulgaris]